MNSNSCHNGKMNLIWSVYYILRSGNGGTWASASIFQFIAWPQDYSGGLRDLLPSVQFWKHEKHPWRSFTEVTLTHGCFSCFWICANGSKSRKASQWLSFSIFPFTERPLEYIAQRVYFNSQIDCGSIWASLKIFQFTEWP